MDIKKLESETRSLVARVSKDEDYLMELMQQEKVLLKHIFDCEQAIERERADMLNSHKVDRYNMSRSDARLASREEQQIEHLNKQILKLKDQLAMLKRRRKPIMKHLQKDEDQLEKDLKKLGHAA